MNGCTTKAAASRAISTIAMAAALGGIAIPMSNAAAQTIPDRQELQGEDAGVIVVTAQKREQNIQDVPLSVQVVNRRSWTRMPWSSSPT